MEWTPEVVISRHQGLLGNIEDELNIGRAVSIIGEDKVKDLMWFHPKEPSIKLDPRITKQDLENDNDNKDSALGSIGLKPKIVH